VVGGKHGEPAVVAVEVRGIRRRDTAQGLAGDLSGIAFDTNGVLVEGSIGCRGSSRPDLPVELAVLTDVESYTCDLLDTGKRRNVRPPDDH
jgi:hypothetical protein